MTGKHRGEGGADKDDVCIVCGFGHEAWREPEGPLLRQPRVLLTIAAAAVLAIALLYRSAFGHDATALLLMGASIAAAGSHIAYDAFRDLLRPSLSVDFLMVVATIGAFVIGEVLEAAAIVFLYSMAEILEDYSEARAGRSIRGLMDLAPREARVRREGEEVTVPVEQVRVGDLMLLRPWERIPMDGRVKQGISAVDEATLTGEAVPTEKGPGGEVLAGTVNQAGYLEVEVTRLAADNTIARVIHMVQAAEVKKARTQRFVENFSLYYTPTVVAVAAGMALLPPLLLGQPMDGWVYRALVLLLVACPCALVISTPVTMVSAITSAARRGVLVKGGVYLEEMAGVDTVVLDKTGTVTKGRIRMTDVIPLASSSREEVLEVARALESRSEHHLAAAILEGAGGDSPVDLPVQGFRAIPGLGVRAAVGQREVLLGSPRLFQSSGIPLDGVAASIERLRGEGKTAVVVGTPEGPLGVLGMADEVRPEAPEVIASLRRLGARRVMLLTGDSEEVGRAVAAAVGADGYGAGMMPGDKARYIQELQAKGSVVAMVGDGVNDAPALATANVGVAMGAAGTYVALETASVTLMADDLSRLPYLLRLSRMTRGVVRQNVVASVAVKMGFFLLTLIPAFLLDQPLVTLWMAVLFGDMGMSLAVIGNALRLARL